jgi:hypothetical protein
MGNIRIDGDHLERAQIWTRFGKIAKSKLGPALRHGI